MKYMIGFNQNIDNYMQIIVTIIFGYIGAIIQSPNSNIHPLLGAVILGGFMSKSLYGDWDKDYNWTVSDIFYWIVTICEALIGGLLVYKIKIK